VDIADQSPLTRSVAEQAQAAIAEADLVLFVTDARAGVMPGDEELAAILRRSHKPVLVIANKIDDPAQDSLALEFHRLGLGDPVPVSSLHGHGTGDLLDAIVTMLPGAGPQEIGAEAIRVAILGRTNVGKSSLLNALLGQERVIVSAHTGRGIDRLLDRIEEQFEKHTGRIGTGELNRFLAELREAREPPSRNGRRLNLLYGTQVRSRPPRFRFFVNDPGLITRD